jgi:hypothetical protein
MVGGEDIGARRKERDTVIPSAQIPVIDISPSNPHAATQLLDAATNYGFVFIENNAAAGVPPANVQDMFDLVSTLVLKNRNRRLMVGIE